MDIINHPCVNAVIGPPSDLSEDRCSGLPVAEIETEDGIFSVSFWKPAQADLDILNDGGCITLWVRAKGRQHPVVALGVSVDGWNES